MSGATLASGFFDRTSDTVGWDTPARAATSWVVTRRWVAAEERLGTLLIRISNRLLSSRIFRCLIGKRARRPQPRVLVSEKAAKTAGP